MHSTLKAVLTDQWPACPYSLGVRGVPQAQDSEVHLTEGGGRQVLPEYEPPEVLQAEEAELRALLGAQDPGRGWEGCVIETRPFFLFHHNGKKILKKKGAPRPPPWCHQRAVGQGMLLWGGQAGGDGVSLPELSSSSSCRCPQLLPGQRKRWLLFPPLESQVPGTPWFSTPCHWLGLHSHGNSSGLFCQIPQILCSGLAWQNSLSPGP